MQIEHATAFLFALKPSGIRFGLELTRSVLEKLCNPHDRFKILHVAGSNGKGSTCAFLDSILRSAGRNVGFFSSPHLVHFRERFVINGQPVSDEAIERAMDRLLSKGLGLDPLEVAEWVEREDLVKRMEQGAWYHERGDASRFTRLTFFECTTVLAVLLFSEAGVDFAVMETGMGGRLDSTNVFLPVASVITPIHLEHTAWLGKTISAIAGEKAGIIKPGIPIVSAVQQEDARTVIEGKAKEQGAPLSMMGVDFDGWGGWRDARFSAGGRNFGPVRLGLIGNHQVINAATAIGCVPWIEKAGFSMSDQVVGHALRSTVWPGRFERFGRSGEWVLDGAHNPDGARVLAETVGDVFGDSPVHLVFGVLKDKEVERMLPRLLPLAREVDLVKPADVRGRDPTTLQSLLGSPATVHDSVSGALEKLAKRPGRPVLVTGSLTVVGEARDWLIRNGILPTVGE